jgi:hypothetical protein
MMIGGKVTASSGKWMKAGVAALALAGMTVATIEPASAFRGGFGGGGRFLPHGGFGGFHGGYGGFRGGYGGYRGGYGYRRGFGGFGTGLLLGGALGYGLGGGYGYGYPYGGYGYYGAGYGYPYGGYGGGCLRRVWGAYGPHWVNVCY